MDAFGPATDERSVVLVLSDGKDSGPTGFGQHFYSQAEVIDRAREEDVMIYGIGMRSRSLQPRQPGIGPGALQAMLMADLPDPGLALVAQETGGGYTEIRFGQDLAAAFAQVADELHSQYLLGFAPPKRDGKVHDISVRVAQRGLKVRARKSYVAPESDRRPPLPTPENRRREVRRRQRRPQRQRRGPDRHLTSTCAIGSSGCD